MIHARATKLRIFPWNNDRDPEQINRAQEISADVTLNQDKLYELGRTGKMGVHKKTPSLPITLRQFEYGSMDFWRALANQEDPETSADDESVDLDDLKSTYVDIAGFLTDDDDTFKGTIHFPKLRVSGFSISIGDPEATIERNFNLIGEDYKIITDNYLAFKKVTVSSTGDEEIELSPEPILWAADSYIFRVLRIRSGAVSELEEGTSDNQWTYNSTTHKLTVKTCLANDIIKVFYPSATAYTTLWTDNNDDAIAYHADQAEVYLKVGSGDAQKIYRIQSVDIDVSFDRTDYKEVGNTEVVQTGVRSKTVTVTINRLLEDFTLEEILRGTSSYNYIDARNFSDDITLIVKIYTDNTKSTFAMGYKIANLSPSTLRFGSTIEEYNPADNTLESDEFMVTTDESEL